MGEAMLEMKRGHMDADMKSSLVLDMADQRQCTMEHRLHVDIASHHIRLLGRKFCRSGLGSSAFSLTCSEVVYQAIEPALSSYLYYYLSFLIVG